MCIYSKLVWLRFEQKFPWQLEESFSWFLQRNQITRFSFESSPDLPLIKILRIWFIASDFSEIDLESLVKSFNLLADTFEVKLPKYILEEVQDEDWSLSWKKHWKEDPVGEKILILPAWLEASKQFSKRTIIRLDPGSAFGTGSHPSTRLCLEEIEHKPPLDQVVADLGCGSGILSLASIKFGAKKVFAVDIDSLAVSATKANFAINNLDNECLIVHEGSVDVLTSCLGNHRADLLLCNILAPIIKTLAPNFENILESNGRAILSGILIEQVKDLAELLCSLGWRIDKVLEKDRWALIQIRRNFKGF